MRLRSTDQALHSLYLNTPVSNVLYRDKDALQLVTLDVLMLEARRELPWVQCRKAVGSAKGQLVSCCADEAQTITGPSRVTL